ncbi:MAG: AmmeMemoRadiSam system protein B, partial [Candidatus Hydrogenedentes bacterium]|nr:AmmeMemoRadiSam system protein B [Candidatus Hydrogenedentota bacterium]
MALPALRNIDAFPIEHEGETLVVVHDPELYVEEQLVLSPIAFFIAGQLDGLNDVTDIQYLLFRETGGQVVSEEQIQEVVSYLDEHGFLESPRFETIHREVVESFAASKTRPVFLAGKSYPKNAADLRRFLDAMFLGQGGPGPINRVESSSEKSVRCLIAPHIDFARGGSAYAHAYARLARGRKPKTVMIFGVAHAGPAVPFILCRKGYETPFGTLEVDLEAVDTLAAACAWDPFEHEIAHRTEHSIEFQAVMLAYLYGKDVQIVPILVGGFSEGPEPVGKASSIPEINAFLEAAQSVVRASNGTMSVLAAVDLAHVGPRFGDTFEIDDHILKA